MGDENVKEIDEIEDDGLGDVDLTDETSDIIKKGEEVGVYDHLTKKELIEMIFNLEKENAILENRLRRARSRGVPRGMGM